MMVLTICAHNLGTAQDDVLHGNWCTDAEALAQRAPLRDKGSAVLPERKLFAPHNSEVAH